MVIHITDGDLTRCGRVVKMLEPQVHELVEEGVTVTPQKACSGCFVLSAAPRPQPLPVPKPTKPKADDTPFSPFQVPLK